MAAGANAGADLEYVDTEQLGLVAISTERRLRLLPAPWPRDNLPPITASLLSVAPNRGLLAAAGPDSLVVGTTQSIREGLRNSQPDDQFSKAGKYHPAASIPVPRCSHVAFSADESCLIIAAEQGGGLAVYETNAITNGSKESQLQIGTNNVSIRHLIPNPARASWELVAVVLSEGQLVLADLKQQRLSQSASGNAVFAEKVYCASWSRLGKQLVVGKEDGTAQQIDLLGNVKADIPAPPQLSQSMPCTSIFWLDTLIFLTVHGPVQEPLGGEGAEPPVWHLVTRDKASGACDFRPVQDPVPSGFDVRLPPNHFMQRLKDWKPHIEDCLILACSGAADIGFITKATSPLQAGHPRVAETVSPNYTSIAIPDHRRGQLPTSVVPDGDGMSGGDTFPIGFCLDASVTEPAPKPFLHGQEPSQKPLPALLALNQEGVIEGWYVVYSDSAQQALPFPGSVAAGLGEQGTFGQNVARPPAAVQSQSTPQQTQASFFGATATPSQPTFGQPSKPAFGQSGGPGLGGSATPSAFGGTSALGQKSSVWGAGGANKPAFGSAPTFGSPSTPGAGQLGGAQPFGSNTGGGSSGGGGSGVFGGGLSSTGGFASLGAKSSGSGGGLFGSQNQAQQLPSTSGAGTSSMFGGSMGQSNGSFAAGQNKPGAGLFGSGATSPPSTSSPFGNLGSNNKNTTGFNFGAPKNDKVEQKPTSSLFGAPKQEPSFASTATLGSASGGSTLGSSWGKPSAPSREETMSDDDDGTATETPANQGKEEKPSIFGAASKEQPSPFGAIGSGPKKEEPSLFGGAGAIGKKEQTPLFGEVGGSSGFSGFKIGSTFKGDGSAKDDLPKPKDGGESAFKSMFGSSLETSTPKPSEPQIKKEPGTGEKDLKDIPEATPTPRKHETAKEEEPASKAEAAPLPPMWAPNETKKAFPEDAPLPPDPTGIKAKEEDSGAPLAGSPPIDLGKETFSPAGSPPTQEKEEAGPPESGDEWSDDQEGEDEDEEDDEEEGSEGEDDDDQDEDEESGDDDPPEHNVEDQKGLDSFMSRVTPASPKKDMQSLKEQKTPETERKEREPLAQSYTPAGMPPGMPHPPPAVQFPTFQPPTRESPRSPSPTRREARNATSPSRLGQQPSMSPVTQPVLPAKQSQVFAQPPSKPQPPKQTTVPPGQAFPQFAGGATPYSSRGQQSMRQSSGLSQVMQAPQPEPQPDPEMDDPAHTYNVDRMKERPERIMSVPNFIAHADHVGDDTKEGIFGSMEKVLRDINSMVDIVGLNAHNLAGFIDAHEELTKNGERSREDLNDPDNWCLEEVPDLDLRQRDIQKALDEGKLEDVPKKLDELRQDEAEAAHLKRKAQELRKQIRLHTDPEKQAQQYAAPLPPETQMQQAELREGVKRVQTLLSQIEDGISLLRADLASLPVQGAGSGGKPDNVPTVEAVENTIRKMTAMVERKSGDIDVLEAQMRRLSPSVLKSMNSLSLRGGYEDDLVSALETSRFARTTRDGSPFATPPPRSRMRMTASGDPLGMSGMLGSSRLRTPPSASLRASTRGFDGGASFVSVNPLAMSTLSVGSNASARKKMRDVTAEEVSVHHAKFGRRKKVLDALRSSVERQNDKDPQSRVVKAN
ncbi:hypothetical protein K431DRAFT_288183 [Polychaeton citri CBS 116435]|uniref:Nucleoporin Nup159/Nup146 N-terminal domain-containing protein n=1 Tax=Polychaeton citri CBS 116435 TaxID=1314669 RepID=A0A9P4UMD1_9PEZI|nr:hypothetical protein K431DRAFT_288183 [Polychaeton citri CBS 116435]